MRFSRSAALLATTILVAVGRWQAYAVHGEGAARCGLKGVGSLQNLALRVGCR